ncbi:MAG: SpoIIE family protein phosphatase [Bacteroidia bacterium]
MFPQRRVYCARTSIKVPLVGIMENARFEVGEPELQPDILLLYTDGITEAMNSQSRCLTWKELNRC